MISGRLKQEFTVKRVSLILFESRIKKNPPAHTITHCFILTPPLNTSGESAKAKKDAERVIILQRVYYKFLLSLALGKGLYSTALKFSIKFCVIQHICLFFIVN